MFWLAQSTKISGIGMQLAAACLDFRQHVIQRRNGVEQF